MADRLSSLLDPSRIDLNVRSTRRITALKTVAEQLESHPEMRNFAGFYRDLLARERLDSTCLGNWVALPHARTEHVGSIVVAVGRTDHAVKFEKTNEDVRLILVLATPRNNPTVYLNIVSTLCKIVRSPAHRDALLAAATPEAFIATLRAAEDAVLNPS